MQSNTFISLESIIISKQAVNPTQGLLLNQTLSAKSASFASPQRETRNKQGMADHPTQCFESTTDIEMAPAFSLQARCRSSGTNNSAKASLQDASIEA